MIDIKGSINYPFEDREWTKKIAIGGIINIIPIVNFIAIGYTLIIFKSFLNKEKPPLPEWKNFGDLFTSGLTIFLICMIYGIIPLFTILIGALFFAIGGIMYLVGGLFWLFGLLGGLIVTFLLPMAIANYITNNRFSNAFEFPIILSKIGDVLSDYIAGFVIMVAMGIGVSIIGIIPVIGWIISMFVGFTLMIISSKIFGEICSNT